MLTSTQTQIPPTRPPVRSFAEVQAALKASDPNTPPLRHTAAHATAGAVSQEERPRLEPVEPSGAPKSPNPLADLLRRMNLSRLLPAFAAHRVDLDVLRAVVAKGQEADLAALLKLSVQEQAQVRYRRCVCVCFVCYIVSRFVLFCVLCFV